MDTEILVVGAGPAGLSTAKTLTDAGHAVVVIDKADRVGASWRSHYERLHLHTVKSLSALPGLDFGSHLPRYVPRQGVVDYLQDYAERAGIAPHFGAEAKTVVPRDGGGWLTGTTDGRTFGSSAVVVTTGANNIPFLPEIAGDDVFAGRILHSREYRSGRAFAGRRVLVVGMGNTGAEIALDLAEHGVPVALSVRSPVNIVHRDVLGRPTQKTSMALARLPQALGDRVASWLCDLTVGDLGRYGLVRSTISPMRQLREHGQTPVIDVGTLARIRSGDIVVHAGIEALVADGARFVDGRFVAVDTIVLATGYRSGVQALFPSSPVPVDGSGLPTQLAGQGALAGVYFVGFDTRQPGGLLRTIGLQAQAVARLIPRGAQTA
jgi:cation diffusion facilitator CzcD-associated flavoprotein CzcO